MGYFICLLSCILTGHSDSVESFELFFSNYASDVSEYRQIGRDWIAGTISEASAF